VGWKDQRFLLGSVAVAALLLGLIYALIGETRPNESCGAERPRAQKRRT